MQPSSNGTNGNGNGKNGWKDWILGVVATMLAAGIGWVIITSVDFARQLGVVTERVTNLEVRINERTAQRYTSDDAKRDRDQSDKDYEKLEMRVKELEVRKH